MNCVVMMQEVNQPDTEDAAAVYYNTNIRETTL